MDGMVNGSVMVVLSVVADRVGMKEAVALGRFHALLQGGKVEVVEGWVRLPIAEWHGLLPFWSMDTVKRMVARLVEAGVLESTAALNATPLDRTKWYRMEEAVLLIYEGVRIPALDQEGSA